MIEPQQVIPAHGLPCAECGQPAHHTEVYPNGRRIVHADRAVRPCTSPPSDTHTNRPERTR